MYRGALGEKPSRSSRGTRNSGSRSSESSRKLLLRTPHEGLALGHPQRHHARVLPHYCCPLLAHHHLPWDLRKHVRGPALSRMSWVQQTGALLMLLLFASVLCNKVGVLLLLLADLQENIFKHYYMSGLKLKIILIINYYLYEKTKILLPKM